ncbi:MAG: hypothetical protein ACYTFI_15610 [Planctomycetota bacterium]|jgi:hypothetical protein
MQRIALGVAVAILGYLPWNWNAEHAKNDVAKADCLVVGRVIGIHLSSQSHRVHEGNKPIYEVTRLYCATVRVARAYKGGLRPGDTFKLPIGGVMHESYEEISENDMFTQTILMMHGTKSGHALDVNGLYFMAINTKLKPPRTFYDLRSGPFSLGLVAQYRVVEGDKLVGTKRTIRMGRLGQEWGPELDFDDFEKRIKDESRPARGTDAAGR